MMLEIGWIGCGTHAAEMLLPQLVRLPVRLVAIADVNPVRLAAVGDRYGVGQRFADGGELLAAARCAAVGMAAGPREHALFAAEALRRGLAVFVEKPPAASAREAAAIAEIAEKTGRPCVVGFMKRFSTANRIAANLLRAPTFGPAVSLLGEYMTAPGYFAGSYESFLLHHAVHAMDLVPWLLGSPVTRVQARKHELGPGKLLLHVGFDCASQALATVVMGTHQSRGTPMEWWQVMGDHRRVEVRNVHEVRYFRAPRFKFADLAATLEDSCDTLVWEPNLTVAANEDHKGYYALLAEFVRAASGEAAEAPTIADGVRAMRVLEAVARSMASGAPEYP